MHLTRRVGAFLAAGAIAITGIVAPNASADTFHDKYPETPKLNPELPIVETTHGSDHIKANILNPHPVCNSGEDYRTVVYKVTENFLPAGTISATNKSKDPIPLTQNLSKSQSISVSIQGDRTDQTSFNFGGSTSKDGNTGSFGIAKTITTKIGGNISYSLSWNVGQTIGPYQVPPNHTGEATYGFRTVNLDGTQQYCRPNGTWSTPTPWRVFAPMKNDVEVKVYDHDHLADAWQGTAHKADAEEPENVEALAAEAAEQLDGEATVSEPDTSVADPAVQDGEDAEPEIIPEESEDPEGNQPADGETVLGEDEAEAAEEAEPADEAEPAEDAEVNTDYDLEPYFTVAAGKAAGFAGLVALRVKNVGDKDYFQENMATRFRIEVHTEDGPEGVDRLITPGWFNGAYTRDLGFDREKSVRTFEVTLSNPIPAGETKLVANLNFGDGLTKLGRIKNYLTVTQIGRLPEDNSTYNDQNVDSRERTQDMMGRANKGIF